MRRVGGKPRGKPLMAEGPEVREYAKFRVLNTVDIAHRLGGTHAVYWPGSLGYYTLGAVEETQMLRWYADALNAAWRTL